MPHYIMLMKLTTQGAKNLGEAPQRIEAAKKAWEELGGTVKSFHITMGEYDYVAVGEAPNDWAAVAFAAKLSAAGDVTTTSMKAFTEDDWKWALNAPAEDIRDGSVGSDYPGPVGRH